MFMDWTLITILSFLGQDFSQRSSPYVFAFSQVIEGKENVRVFSYGVVGKALEIDKQVVRDGNPARITMTLPHAVPLEK